MAISFLLRLKEVLFKSKLRSKVVRENFQDVEDYLNNLKKCVDNISVAGSANETVQARDFFTTLQDRLREAATQQGNHLIYGGEVLAYSLLQFRVKALTAIVNGVACRIGFGTWERTASTVTITEAGHGLINGKKIFVDISDDAGALPLIAYTVFNVTTDTFDVNGVDTGATSGACEFSRVSDSVTMPVSDVRLDYVTVNSDNTISVNAGTLDATPIFPTLAKTQLLIGGLVCKTATTAFTDKLNLFNLKHTNSKVPDVYIGTARDIPRGEYQFNNLILDAAVTLAQGVPYTGGGPFTLTQSIDRALNNNFTFDCLGNYFETTNHSWTLGDGTSRFNYDRKSNLSPGKIGGSPNEVDGGDGGNWGFDPDMPFAFDFGSGNGAAGGDGYDAAPAGNSGIAGGGGGGGGSVYGAGGDGGAGGSDDVVGAVDGAGGSGGRTIPSFVLKAFNAFLNSDLSFDGIAGSVGQVASNNGPGGGGGGSAGATIFLFIINELSIDSALTISADGGDGGNGGNNATDGGGGGGGGGAGGYIYILYNTIINSGSLSTSVTGGTGGTGGTHGTEGGSLDGVNGGDGDDGLVVQKDYAEQAAIQTDFQSCIIPFHGKFQNILEWVYKNRI